MDDVHRGLEVDPPVVCRTIEDVIGATMADLGRDGAVVGLSGGLDSAVAATLAVRSLGSERVHLINMPERDSSPVHRKHARMFAAHLGIRLVVKPITSALRATNTYRLLPISLVPGRSLRAWLVETLQSRLLKIDEDAMLDNRFQPEANSWVAKGNAYVFTKHRLRAVILYQYADVRNLMVVGAANRTEWLTGTFSKWGIDQCADVMPLLHLYRSQVEQVAEHIQVPEYIRNKPSDPDVMPGTGNKGDMLGGFATADQILHGIERNVDRKKLCRAYGKENVQRISALWEASGHMRESPCRAG